MHAAAVSNYSVQGQWSHAEDFIATQGVSWRPFVVACGNTVVLRVSDYCSSKSSVTARVECKADDCLTVYAVVLVFFRFGHRGVTISWPTNCPAGFRDRDN